MGLLWLHQWGHPLSWQSPLFHPLEGSVLRYGSSESFFQAHGGHIELESSLWDYTCSYVLGVLMQANFVVSIDQIKGWEVHLLTLYLSFDFISTHQWPGKSLHVCNGLLVIHWQPYILIIFGYEGAGTDVGGGWWHGKFLLSLQHRQGNQWVCLQAFWCW